MRSSRGSLVVLAGLFSAASASASCSTQVRAVDAWARATPAGAAVGVAYVRILGSCAADRLLRVVSTVSDRVEVHTMEMQGDVMRMRPLEATPIPAEATVEFAPGGLHLMLLGLKQPLREGSSIPLELVFERGGRVSVQAVIGSVAAVKAPERRRSEAP